MNNATAALLAAHGHHSAITGHFNSASAGNQHHHSPHLIGGGGRGLFSNLSQYLNSGPGGNGSSNSVFTSYHPLAAHIKAAFPSMFPQLYIHNHHPTIFPPPLMIPPPPLISPQKSFINHGSPSGFVRSSSPTNNIPSSLVAKLNNEQQSADAFSKTDNLQSTNELDSGREQQHQKTQSLGDGQREKMQEESSPIPSTPPINNNNDKDDRSCLEEHKNILPPKSTSDRNHDRIKSANCVAEKLDGTIFISEKEESKACNGSGETSSKNLDSLNIICNQIKYDYKRLANEDNLFSKSTNNEGETLKTGGKAPLNVEKDDNIPGKICWN